MPLLGRCLALQWCAESCGAEISAASPGYQRETSFVNSSPTVSRLHSWLTALCVPLPCLHTASKALLSSLPCIPSLFSLSLDPLSCSPSSSLRSLLWLSLCETYTHTSTQTNTRTHTVHTVHPRTQNCSDPSLRSHYSTLPSQPLPDFDLLYHHITLLFYTTYYTCCSPPKTPDPLIPRRVNCSSRP